MAFNFVFLTQQFYNDYSHCSEIEQKIDRPYTVVLVRLYGIDFAIPFRSNIKHPHVVWTDRENNCGLDLSKTVVIKDKQAYIDNVKKPSIRQYEFDTLRGREGYVLMRLKSYIDKYKKALNKQDIYKNQLLCQFSTLQYFHSYIGL